MKIGQNFYNWTHGFRPNGTPQTIATVTDSDGKNVTYVRSPKVKILQFTADEEVGVVIETHTKPIRVFEKVYSPLN